MPKPKPEKMGIKDAVAEAAAMYPPRPAPKAGAGRKPTVDYDRIGKLMKDVTGLKAEMWGDFIIGFGTYLKRTT